MGSCRKAREKKCERVAIGFGFTSNWMKEWRDCFLANRVANENRSKTVNQSEHETEHIHPELSAGNKKQNPGY